MKITLLTHTFVRLAITAGVVAGAAPASVNAQQSATIDVVSSFDPPFGSGNGPSSLRHDSNGTFYGTASSGGRFGGGVLFRMDAAGVVTPLHGFQGAVGPYADRRADAEGTRPFGLVGASNGRFYGLTQTGGQFGWGTVFTFTPGSAPTTVHGFSDAEAAPVDLFAAADGNVYGLTASVNNSAIGGVIFAIDPSGSYRPLFSIPVSAGGTPASLVRASDGRFYVTAQQVGSAPETVFMIDDAGTITNIHTFSGAFSDGPIGLMQRSDGRLYGTTVNGGEFDLGIVYAIDLDGTFRVVHSFNAGEGAALGIDLVETSDGNLYGATHNGLFTIDSSDTLTMLQTASGQPPVDLTVGIDERLYAPTASGGPDWGGTIVTFDVTGTRTTIYEFRDEGGPAQPTGIIQAHDGRFYGGTSGSFSSGIGTVFAMDATGTRTTLHTFVAATPTVTGPGQIWTVRNDGVPLGHLFEGADGGVYGTTYTLLKYLYIPVLPVGQIFRIAPDGTFTLLASARGLQAGIIQARDGRLYGVRVRDPWAGNMGSIFRLDTNGTLTTLYTFGTTAGDPVGELVEIDDGSLYGATAGTVQASATIFQVDPATGAFAIRHSFTDGASPTGRLIQGTDGLLYGSTSNGGAFGLGTVFSLDAAGTLTSLHHFSGADGANPNAGVIQGTDGRLYGTTTNGGAFGYGTVFVMNVTGGLTTLHEFALSDGANPVSELFQANDGTFYGATPAGGPRDGGVISRVRLDTSPADAYYELVSRNSGKCLDVFGASTDAVASVIQWVCHGGENQQWRLEPAGGGAFRIVARHSGQALDVFGALLDDVTPLIQYPVTGGDNQVWTLEPASDGYVTIVARHSGKALDVEFASPDDGARVIQYTPHGGANQQWLLRRLESTASPSTP